MFKYDKDCLPHPINNLFALNNERHNYNTRHNHDLQINTGKGEIVYKLFSFFSFQLRYNMHVLRTYQNLIYKTMIYCM